MKNRLFNTIAIRKPKSNAFDLSHEKKLTCNMADLIPVYFEPVIPGDKIRVKTEALIRMAPLTFPVMHRMNVYIHYFKVPYRLVWDNWETFITGGEQEDTPVPNFPKIAIEEGSRSLYGVGSLADYFGIPVPLDPQPITQQLAMSALPFRAYQLIYNEYYRDQNLQDKIPFTKGDSVNSTETGYITTLRQRAWEKDYFTSCLPNAQKGNPVNIPTTLNYKTPSQVTDVNGGLVGGDLTANGTDLMVGSSPAIMDNLSSLGITINDLRKSARLQEWLEKNMRGGSRYVESILSHFGVVSSNKLLQRPQYLGGGKMPIQISEVLSTFNNAEVPGANMYGHGLSAGSMPQINDFAEEHAYIIGLMSILPRTAYMNQTEKEWFKFDKFDFAWPEFANIGEQEVLNREVYHDYYGLKNNADTFGYQSRYAEYKFKQSTVHGDFRDTLYSWHLARMFTQSPALNSQFITANPRTDIFAVTDENVHKLYVQLYNSVQAIRPLPVYGTPML